MKRSAPEKVEVRIVWISGHYSILQARTPVRRSQDVTNREQLISRIEQLWQQGVSSDEEMAARLTAEGYYSARREGVCASAVQKIRLTHGWQYGVYQSRHTIYGEGYLTVDQCAAKVGVERTWILKRIYAGAIVASAVKRLPQSRVWLIKDDPALIARLQQEITAHRHP